jgi:uncharacterized membrane protein YphA (DoxX/SURF4 family)
MLTQRRLTVLGSAMTVVFLASGLSKLAGLPSQVQLFEAFGFRHWVLPVVGSIELVLAMLVFRPVTRPWGAIGIALVMAGAVITRAMTGVALPMMLLDALLFSAAVYIVVKQRPAFLAIHWPDERPSVTRR